jgi:hypothetical protein
MGNSLLNVSSSTIQCQPTNILIKNAKFQKLIHHLYFMVENLNNNSCAVIGPKLSTLWFIIYSLIILLIIFAIVFLFAVFFNLIFKIEKIKSNPATNEEVEKLLIEKYNPSKADNYFYKAQRKLGKQEIQDETEVISIEENKSIENIPKRFDLENFLINDVDAATNNKQTLNLTTFPAVNDELELYMKLLLAQVTSQNHSVENSAVYKIYDEYKEIFNPKEIYKKSLELGLNAINYFK